MYIVYKVQVDTMKITAQHLVIDKYVHSKERGATLLGNVRTGRVLWRADSSPILPNLSFSTRPSLYLPCTLGSTTRLLGAPGYQMKP